MSNMSYTTCIRHVWHRSSFPKTPITIPFTSYHYIFKLYNVNNHQTCKMEINIYIYIIIVFDQHYALDKGQFLPKKDTCFETKCLSYDFRVFIHIISY